MKDDSYMVVIHDILLEQPVPMAIINGDQEIVVANKALNQLLERHDERGMESFAELVHPDEVLPGDGSIPEKARLYHGEGELLFCRIRKGRHSQLPPDYQLLYFEDITQAEIGSYRLESVVEKLTQLEADYARFTFSASHDLNEPIDKIKAFINLLEMGNRNVDDREYRQNLRYIVEASDRLQSRLDSLLIYSRINTHPRPMEPISLNLVLDDVLEVLRPIIEKSGAEIKRDPLPEIIADPVQMKILFSNLMDNALKFHEEGSIPKVSVEVIQKTRMVAHSELPMLTHPEEFFSFTIRDNGIGFDSTHASKIFQPFVRLVPKHAYPGNGMGLAICRAIALRHNGYIAGRGELGNGSIFKMLLPRTCHSA